MKLLESIKGVFRKKALSPGAWLRGEEGVSSGSLGITSAQQQSTWIYSCVRTLAENVANIPFRFSSTRDGEGDVIDQGDFVTLFNQPHPYLSRFEFWELIVSWLMLRGQRFVIGLGKNNEVINWRNGFGAGPKPVQLLILNADRMRMICTDGILQGWAYTKSGNDPMPSMVFLPEEVNYQRLPGIGDLYDGYSPLVVAMLAAQTDYHAAQFMKGLMQNNADQGMVVGTEQTLSDEQRAQIDAAIRNRKRMAGRADKPLILEGGLKVEKPTVSSADLQFLENRKYNRQEICAIFGVPQELLGFTEDANRSVGDSARLNFIENRIIPFCERLALGIDPIVKRLGEDLEGWFDSDTLPIMQEARRARFTGAVSAFGIGVPIDVCNDVFDLGLPDDLPHKGKSYLPFSLQEVGASPAGPQPAEPGSQQDQSNADATGGQTPGKAVDRLLKRIADSKSPSDQPAAVNHPQSVHVCAPSASAYEAAIAGSIKLKAGKLSKFFWEQRGRVLARLEQEFKRIELERAAQRQQPINVQVDIQMPQKTGQRILAIRDDQGNHQGYKVIPEGQPV